MKFFKEYIITVIVGLLLAVVLIVSGKDEGNTLTNAKQQSYEDNWTVRMGKDEKFYKQLPDTLPRNTNEKKFTRRGCTQVLCGIVACQEAAVCVAVHIALRLS